MRLLTARIGWPILCLNAAPLAAKEATVGVLLQELMDTPGATARLDTTHPGVILARARADLAAAAAGLAAQVAALKSDIAALRGTHAEPSAHHWAVWLEVPGGGRLRGEINADTGKLVSVWIDGAWRDARSTFAPDLVADWQMDIDADRSEVRL